MTICDYESPTIRAGPLHFFHGAEPIPGVVDVMPFLGDETGLLGAVDERNRARIQGIEADQLTRPAAF